MGLLDSINSTAPQDNARSAFEYYVSQGLTPVQAAGIVGNLQGESGQGLNPNAVNRGDGRDGSDSIGIGQWNSTRAQALKEFAAAKGVPWNDFNTQLEFLHQELKGPERGAYDRLMAAKTPEEAGQAMLAFERPKDWNKPGAHPERGQYAAKVFASYGGGQPQPAPQAAPAIAPSNPVASAIMGAPQAPQAPMPQTAGDVASQLMGTQARPQAGGSFDVPPIESAPIQFAKRRAPDMSKLRALFQPPNFSRG
jgi:hypothetical protein